MSVEETPPGEAGGEEEEEREEEEAAADQVCGTLEPGPPLQGSE